MCLLLQRSATERDEKIQQWETFGVVGKSKKSKSTVRFKQSVSWLLRFLVASHMQAPIPSRKDHFPMSGHGGGGGYRPARRNGQWQLDSPSVYITTCNSRCIILLIELRTPKGCLILPCLLLHDILNLLICILLQLEAVDEASSHTHNTASTSSFCASACVCVCDLDVSRSP